MWLGKQVANLRPQWRAQQRKSAMPLRMADGDGAEKPKAMPTLDDLAAKQEGKVSLPPTLSLPLPPSSFLRALPWPKLFFLAFACHHPSTIFL
jgi:hypothetical protein